MGRGKKRNLGVRPLPPQPKRLGRGPRPAGLDEIMARLRAARDAELPPPPPPPSAEELLRLRREHHLYELRRNPAIRFRAANQRLLFQRLGHLNPVRQDRGFAERNAPARRGIWAFPWPAGDIGFFAGHKWDEVLPKRLREETMATLADEVYELPRMTPEERVERERRSNELDALYEERERWIRERGPKALPLRQFWLPFQEEIFCHLTPEGRYLGMGEWQRLSVGQFLAAAKKARPEGSGPFEVFIPRR